MSFLDTESGKLLAVIVGPVLTYAFIKYRLHVSERTSQLSDHVRDIERLVESSVTLWSTPALDDKINERCAKVDLYHRLATEVYETISRVCYDRSDAYRELMHQLFTQTATDEITAFNEAERKERLKEVINTSAELTSLVRSVRAEVSTLPYMWKDLGYQLKAVWKWIDHNLLTP